MVLSHQTGVRIPVALPTGSPRIGLLLLAAALLGCGAPSARAAKGDVAKAIEASLAGGRGTFEHAAWDRMLAGGTRDGLVDYGFMRTRRGDLDAYLGRLAAAKLDTLAPAHLEALLINAYNAYTVRAILDHPGVGSIRKIPGVWTATRHLVGGFELTLDDLEHRILRPFFKDPRVHFVLNCASRSCAPLPPWAYSGERLEAQMEERTRAFLADPRNVRLEDDRLLVSRYFDWYGADFTASGWRGAAPTIQAYIARYAAPEVAAVPGEKRNVALEFLEYDWNLNAAPPSGVP